MEETQSTAAHLAKNMLPSFRIYANAIRLIELGARATLVCQLTDLPRARVKAWYQEIHGRPSPPGLAPFSDAWYVQTKKRKLHTNIVWKLGVAAARLEDDPAHHLTAVYESYLCTVPTPLLNITHAYFVRRLLPIKAWCTALCKECCMEYIGPVTDVSHLCPACLIQRAYRCPRCNAALTQKCVGRKRKRCLRCLTLVQ